MNHSNKYNLLLRSSYSIVSTSLHCIVLLTYLPIESPIKSKDLDLSMHSTKQLSPDYRIHWRILKDKNEIEIVAVVNGTSWVGIGWRPRKLNASCRNFPLIQGLDKPNQSKGAQLSVADKVKPAPEPESREHALCLDKSAACISATYRMHLFFLCRARK